jgi:hypothetical protein
MDWNEIRQLLEVTKDYKYVCAVSGKTFGAIQSRNTRYWKIHISRSYRDKDRLRENLYDPKKHF